jgi:hypothetical protein
MPSAVGTAVGEVKLLWGRLEVLTHARPHAVRGGDGRR